MALVDSAWSRSFAAIVLMLALSSCSPAPTEEDRKAIEGVWRPEDGSGHDVRFAATGVFDYLYDPQASFVLELAWELRTKGKLVIKAEDGTVVRTCDYTIEADKLSIDDGAHGACIEPSVTPHVPMPLTFRRAT